MEKTRTLPPLVRGRVTAALDFFIDDIKLTNCLLLSDTCDLLLQIQWWGEDLPTYVRPRSFCDRENKFDESSEIHFQGLRYEIKTTADLFKLYLQTCEVLELCILDFKKNSILGSAFLKDLTKLLDRSTNCFILPVFDYLGEEIGNLVVHFNFSQKRKQEITYDNKTGYGTAPETEGPRILNKKTEYFYTPTEENFFYDRGKKINLNPMDANAFCKSKKNNSDNCCNDSVTEYLNYGKKDSLNDKIVTAMEFPCKYFPEINAVNDSSKILYFGLSSLKSKKSEDPKNGVKNKFNSNSIKFKRKSSSAKKLSSYPSNSTFNDKKVSNRKPVIKEVSEHIKKQSDVKENEISSVRQFEQSQMHSNFNETVQDDSSKETLQSKVLDFLLGSHLSKEDEESAVNEFKKMSPSHNLVTSINKLCLTSDSDSHVSVNMHSKNSKVLSCLSYNLNDPIEKNYYEKFFQKPKPSFDLELAELLNQPENSIVLENLKSRGVASSNKISQSADCSNKFFQCRKGDKKEINDENSLKFFKYNNVNDKAKNCSRCKYYKKLDELDTIIESLKHFEEKMRTHESDVQTSLRENPDWFGKKKQPEGS